VKENPETPEEVESPEGIDSSDADLKHDFPGGNAGKDDSSPKSQNIDSAAASAVKENPETPEEVESPEGIDSSDADLKHDFPGGNAGKDDSSPKSKNTDSAAASAEKEEPQTAKDAMVPAEKNEDSNINVPIADAVKDENPRSIECKDLHCLNFLMFQAKKDGIP